MRRGRQPSMLWGQLYPAHANLQHETRLCDQWGGKCVAIIYRITRPLDPTIHLAFAILCARLERMGDWAWRASPYCRNHSFHLSPSTLNLLWADTEAHLSLVALTKEATWLDPFVFLLLFIKPPLSFCWENQDFLIVKSRHGDICLEDSFYTGSQI